MWDKPKKMVSDLNQDSDYLHRSCLDLNLDSRKIGLTQKLVLDLNQDSQKNCLHQDFLYQVFSHAESISTHVEPQKKSWNLLKTNYNRKSLKAEAILSPFMQSLAACQLSPSYEWLPKHWCSPWQSQWVCWTRFQNCSLFAAFTRPLSLAEDGLVITAVLGVTIDRPTIGLLLALTGLLVVRSV